MAECWPKPCLARGKGLPSHPPEHLTYGTVALFHCWCWHQAGWHIPVQVPAWPSPKRTCPRVAKVLGYKAGRYETYVTSPRSMHLHAPRSAPQGTLWQATQYGTGVPPWCATHQQATRTVVSRGGLFAAALVRAFVCWGQMSAIPTAASCNCLGSPVQLGLCRAGDIPCRVGVSYRVRARFKTLKQIRQSNKRAIAL